MLRQRGVPQVRMPLERKAVLVQLGQGTAFRLALPPSATLAGDRWTEAKPRKGSEVALIDPSARGVRVVLDAPPIKTGHSWTPVGPAARPSRAAFRCVVLHWIRVCWLVPSGQSGSLSRTDCWPRMRQRFGCHSPLQPQVATSSDSIRPTRMGRITDG